VTVSRREVLGTLGVASASTLLWAFGCGGPAQTVRRAPQVSGQVRAWLHHAVARLVAIYPTVHALAVSRTRTTAAVDVLGTGLARLRADGVVFTVRGADGRWREHVTSELTEPGINAALDALGAPARRRSLDFGPAPTTPAEPPRLDPRDLRERVELLQRDPTPSSRIVYAAALLDIDDAIVWSVEPGRDLEQRLVRIRQAATRAAWNGPRPSVGHVERVWSGGLDDHSLSPADLAAAGDTALELTTPGTLEDAQHTLVLDPGVVARLVDTAARHLLTASATAARRPDITPRAAPGTQLASPLITLLDDPTTRGAYGSFAFDDEGERAAPVTLLDAGRITAHLRDRAAGGTGRGRRPDHLAPVEPSPSHLLIAAPAGATPTADLYTDGFVLEGGQAATYHPATDRIRITCARARELKAGNTTGRLYSGVELVGSLTALLTAVDAVSSDPLTFSLDNTHPRRWSSIAVPALRTRGLLRARRSRA
jgi:predicted Zn-dependent protease